MQEKRKTRLGRVIGDKMQKTVIVAVEVAKRHPLYHKPIKKEIKYKVHDEKDECKLGDVVRIIETRPMSRYKRWRVQEIVTKVEALEAQVKEIA